MEKIYQVKINGKVCGTYDELTTKRMLRTLAIINPDDKVEAVETESDLGELNLSVRSHNVLLRAGLYTIAEVMAVEPELERVRFLGKRGAHEVRSKLNGLGR